MILQGTRFHGEQIFYYYKINTLETQMKLVCDSYPTELYVPKSATAHIIVGSSKFRSRRRFPALSYYCKESHVRLKTGLCFSWLLGFILDGNFSSFLCFSFLSSLFEYSVCVYLNSQ